MQIIEGKASEVPENSVAIAKDAVRSVQEIRLAHHLAESSFRNKTNIAKEFKYEFLLWLSGTKDIESALKRTKPDKECIIIVFDKEGEKHNLRKNADPLDIERISLSRI